MNRNPTPLHQENYPFFQYVGAQQPILPPGYIPNGSFYPVMPPMIMPLFQIQQNNNPNNKHQPQIISQQQQQQQPNAIIGHKKTAYATNVMPKAQYHPWSPEEDQHIIAMVKMNGFSWEGIARTLHDRTGIEVQNRYHELKNRMALPIPSIQARPMNGFYEDIDANNESKEENSLCFLKHVSYNISNNRNYINMNRGTYPSPNQISENFEFISCENNNYDDTNNSNYCVLNFVSPDNEFN